jgi:hypothetical protein
MGKMKLLKREAEGVLNMMQRSLMRLIASWRCWTRCLSTTVVCNRPRTLTNSSRSCTDVLGGFFLLELNGPILLGGDTLVDLFLMCAYLRKKLVLWIWMAYQFLNYLGFCNQKSDRCFPCRNFPRPMETNCHNGPAWLVYRLPLWLMSTGRTTRETLLSEAGFEKVFRTQNWVRWRKLFCRWFFLVGASGVHISCCLNPVEGAFYYFVSSGALIVCC